MRRALAITLAAGALSASIGGALASRGVHTSTPRGERSVASPLRPSSAQAMPQVQAPRPSIAATPALTRADAAAQAYAVDALATRDERWASQTEALHEPLRAALLEGDPRSALAADLQLECRARYCRLSVPVPQGGSVQSLPVIAAMADALQRIAPSLERQGEITGERVEPSDPAQPRRYALYLQRRDATVERSPRQD